MTSPVSPTPNNPGCCSTSSRSISPRSPARADAGDTRHVSGGRLVFAAIALVVSLPFLLRIHRRFKTWLAPAIALTAMAAMFLLSSFVIGPLITGSDGGAKQPGIEQPAGHAGHHDK